MALVRKDAAILVKDAEASEKLMDTALELVRDEARLARLGKNAGKLAKTDAAMDIAKEVYRLLDKKDK